MPLYVSLTLPIIHEQRPARLQAKFNRQSFANRLPSHNWKKCPVATWHPYKKVNFGPWGLIAWGKSILFFGKWKWWSGGQVKLDPILLVQSKAISYLKSDSKMSKTMTNIVDKAWTLHSYWVCNILVQVQLKTEMYWPTCT